MSSMTPEPVNAWAMREAPCKIMLVDDRPDKLLAMQSILADLGQEIVTCSSGKDALRQLLRDDYAVILLDVRMPIMDGFETATLIRQRPRCADVPIIFVTAINSSDNHVSRGYSLGAVDYIFAPVVPEILRAKVQVFIELFRKSKQIRMQLEGLRESSQRRVANVESRFQKLLNRLNVGVFRANDAGRVIEANPAFLRLLGIRDIAQISEVDLRRLQLHQQHTDTYPVIRDGVAPQREGDVELRRANGDRIWVALSKARVVDADGAVFIDGLIEDITERKNVEQALTAKAAELARSNYDLEQFASVASHDLQEPLRMINVYLDLLRLRHSKELCPQALEYLAHAQQGSVRMRSLIKDLLTYSQIGNKQIIGSEVDSEDVLSEVLTYLKPRIAELHATVVSSPLPRVWIDKVQLVQLFQNLLSNALKFHGPDPPHVQIACERDGHDWRFSISDNGIGIDPKYHQHVFELFRRLHTTSAYPGTGIGLASCKRIVERFGGRIWLTSDRGQGTTFVFTLPALNSQDDVAVECIDLGEDSI